MICRAFRSACFFSQELEVLLNFDFLNVRAGACDRFFQVLPEAAGPKVTSLSIVIVYI